MYENARDVYDRGSADVCMKGQNWSEFDALRSLTGDRR
jgi:hypothetical protein